MELKRKINEIKSSVDDGGSDEHWVLYENKLDNKRFKLFKKF